MPGRTEEVAVLTVPSLHQKKAPALSASNTGRGGDNSHKGTAVLRIIDGMVYEGTRSADRFVVTLHELGNGQREACVQRAVDWVESGPLDPDSIAAQVLRGEREDPAAAEKAEANRKRSARRAKSRLRRLCKTLGLDCMMTLTYRGNQTDLALCKAHMKEFVRRIKRVIPGFVYAAAFEPQERGAQHVHMAVRRVQPSFIQNGVRVKSYDLIRAIWRSVSGEWGGTVNIGKDKPWKRYSPGRLAAYMSKYMLKAFEDGDEWSNRYSGSVLGAARPKPVRMHFNSTTMGDLMELLYSEVCGLGRDAFCWFSPYGDTFYVSTEPELPLPAWKVRELTVA